MCLGVRAIAVYKSVARYFYLLSFICLKNVYSWFTIEHALNRVSKPRR